MSELQCLTLPPLEAKGLLESSIDLAYKFHHQLVFTFWSQGETHGIGGNVAATLGISRVARTEIALDVKDRAGTARAYNGRDKIEGVAVSVVGA